MPRDAGDGADAPRELTVQVAAGNGEPERLMILARAGGGRVRVREWTSAGWGTPPDEREVAPEALYAWLETAVRRGRRVSEELYRIRRWLDADAP
ncbi:MAG TPA: hypothetical protein VNA89_10030 [Gemmatimonadaceae bacterium]|nr:hypothetical protein [Gemmatimonadaceae bacterium]